MLHLDSLSPDKSQLFIAEHMLTHCVPIQRTSWQSTNAPSPARELHNVVMEFPVPDSLQQWQDLCQPDLPWAEEHFQERVSGQPLNPPPSFIRWPWHSAEEASKFLTENKKFDHTYPERYWPRDNLDEEQTRYGDLNDIVRLLRKDTWTRQAYLPVWFPEDTGTTSGQRVPCTLGYQLIRNGPTLDCNYFLRSCDLTRHYKNDVYLTGRLLQWMVENVQDKEGLPYAGTLTVFITNLHLFTADVWRFQ